ncbi:hypothetical protein [Halovivax gelatinilyticus]|nr:hypothetical protein [Halovivax gelatinilyticus]
MSSEPARKSDQSEDDEPEVPEAVLEAIDNLAEGETASKEEIADVLKF